MSSHRASGYETVALVSSKALKTRQIQLTAASQADSLGEEGLGMLRPPISVTPALPWGCSAGRVHKGWERRGQGLLQPWKLPFCPR